MLYEHQTTLYKSYLYYFKNLCSYEYMRTIGRIGHLNGASTKQNMSSFVLSSLTISACWSSSRPDKLQRAQNNAQGMCFASIILIMSHHVIGTCCQFGLTWSSRLPQGAQVLVSASSQSICLTLCRPSSLAGQFALSTLLFLLSHYQTGEVCLSLNFFPWPQYLKSLNELQPKVAKHLGYFQQERKREELWPLLREGINALFIHKKQNYRQSGLWINKQKNICCTVPQRFLSRSSRLAA